MSNGPQEAFLSYAREDDDHTDGWITRFRMQIEKAVSLERGRRFDVFQDTENISWGQDWQYKIDNALANSSILIPIVTPRFFESQQCKSEIRKFLNREVQLGRADLVLPVYLINTTWLNNHQESDFRDEVADVLAQRQLSDWRELRFAPAKSASVRRAIATLARSIVATVGSIKQTSWTHYRPGLSPLGDDSNQAVASNLAVSPRGYILQVMDARDVQIKRQLIRPLRLDRNVPLPHETSTTFAIDHEAESLDIKAYEQSGIRETEDLSYWTELIDGSIKFGGAPAPAGTPITLSIKVTLDGIFELSSETMGNKLNLEYTLPGAIPEC